MCVAAERFKSAGQRQGAVGCLWLRSNDNRLCGRMAVEPSGIVGMVEVSNTGNQLCLFEAAVLSHWNCLLDDCSEKICILSRFALLSYVVYICKSFPF